MLYRTTVGAEVDDHRKVLVLPEKYRIGAMRQLHDSRTAGHLGQKKTLQRLRERYFWLGQRLDVEKWCKGCSTCVNKSKPRVAHRAPMKVYVVGAPMERLTLDILGPLPESNQGNRYILCIGDYFTRWVWAVALPDQEARTIAEVLVEQVFTNFGLPRIIHTDQGRNFESILFRELCRYFDIDKTRTTP